MSPLDDEQALWAELDALAHEAPPGAEDLGAQLLETCAKHRDARSTERPGEERDWGR